LKQHAVVIPEVSKWTLVLDLHFLSSII